MSGTETPTQNKRPREVTGESPLLALLKKSKLEKNLTAMSHTESAVSNIDPAEPVTVAVLVTLLVAHAADLEDQYESELHKRDKKIMELQNQVDHLEQYTRRNSVRITGVPEESNLSSTVQVESILTEKLNLTVEPWELIGTHRVGPPTAGKPRPILAKFISHHKKTEVVKARSKLKGSSVFINEDLTKTRALVFKKARIAKKDKKIKDTWTYDGRIFIKRLDDTLKILETIEDWDKLFPNHDFE